MTESIIIQLNLADCQGRLSWNPSIFIQTLTWTYWQTP